MILIEKLLNMELPILQELYIGQEHYQTKIENPTLNLGKKVEIQIL